jgi:uncharacterized membrane protein YfcA
MGPLQAVILLIAALLGSTLNSVAGGGSFISFPALVVTGVPPIQANATSTVALWPGSLASIGAYRGALVMPRRQLLVLAGVSVVGGVLGALLLIHTPQRTFERLIPYLLLLATVLFALGNTIAARVRQLSTKLAVPPWLAAIGMISLQATIAIYGGYFGGGMSILILALLAVMGLENMHTMNAVKVLLASCINGVAVLTFIVAGVVAWPQALVMVAGAIIGGYGGAYIARRMEPHLVRRFVILVGCVMTIYFFVRPA